MSGFSRLTKIYLYVIYAAGLILFVHNVMGMRPPNLLMLAGLCIVASLALVYKVEGKTNRSHYAVSFVVYAFTFAQLGLPAALITILVSNLVYWVWQKGPWFISLFNASCYIVVMQACALVFYQIDPTGKLSTWQGVIALALGFACFNILNHLMVGMIVWLARGENFQQAGTFNLRSLMLDMTLLSMGAMMSVVWDNAPFAILLAAFPLYLLYGTLKVPALERQTEIDSKTGLFNLNYFTSQLEHELSRANRFDRPLSLIMADLDFLRNINNTYGHLAGDEILVGVSKILKRMVRDYDVVARFGGEEFSMMMPETPIAKAYDRAEEIRREIEQTDFTISTSVTPVKITMSFGIAGRERYDQQAKDILHNADLALYHSKFTGRNRVSVSFGDEFNQYEGASASEMDGSSPLVSRDEMAHPSLPHIPTPSPREEGPAVKPAPQNGAVHSSLPPASPQPSARPDPTRSAANAVNTVPRARRDGQINTYIGMVVAAAFGLSALVYSLTPNPLAVFSLSGILGLTLFCLMVAATEWFSIDIFINKNSISTSAAPMIAGVLLFGPVGALVLSIVFSFTAFIKNRIPFSRFFFNASNQIIASMIYLGLIALSGHTFTQWAPIAQVLVILLISQLVYLVTTCLVAVGVSMSFGQKFSQVWVEQFSWLSSFYLVIGFISYAMVFGYQFAYITGTIIMIVPLWLLRYYQKQSIERTRAIVTELREKNAILQKTSENISSLSQALLDILAEVIDLRDPYLSGHSHHVTVYATQIARRMGLNDHQVEIIRKSSLLHDIGKLGVSEALLGKPTRLTEEEFRFVRKHPEMGAQLLGKSPSLHMLIPIVLFHHEFYNGCGYPNRLKENEIPIEARIVSVADAIEAMASDRPYRKGQDMQYIIEELRRCAGSQFDPHVVDVAIEMLAAAGDNILVRTVVADQQPERNGRTAVDFKV